MIAINPIVALILFSLLIIIVFVIFYPDKGILARYQKSKKLTKKVLIEDVLKHLFDYEYKKLSPTINSIAGNLGISLEKTNNIINKLKSLKLISIKDYKISLTPQGRSYALRIIRVHRLWENYLAEETSFREIDWHDQAELVEHSMTEEEANLLAAQMGNPLFDPHGDPIPTSDGRLLGKKGNSLNDTKEGEVVRIIHIEDEPKFIYSELLAQELFPGKELLIVEKFSDKIKFACDGEERNISPMLANNVTVEPIESSEFVNEKGMNLADLKEGEIGEIIKLSMNCRGQQRRRLLDFGIVPGAKVRVLMKSPLNDPIAYLVKDTIVALRKNQAELILIKV